MSAYQSVGGYAQGNIRGAACKWLNENTERWAKNAVDTRKPTLTIGVTKNDLPSSMASEIFNSSQLKFQFNCIVTYLEGAGTRRHFKAT